MRSREFPPWPQRIFYLVSLVLFVGFAQWAIATPDRFQELLIFVIYAGLVIVEYEIMALLYDHLDSKGRLSADG